MYEYTHRHRVRYREVDPMGLVYHAHYVDYFEVARTEMLRDIGLVYKQIESEGIIMPVVELQINYHRPAYYDDLLEITAQVAEVPVMRAEIDYEVRREGEDQILTTGRVTLCFVDRARQRPVRAPENLRIIFQRALDSVGSSADPS